jgi:hypothetical protein
LACFLTKLLSFKEEECTQYLVQCGHSSQLSLANLSKAATCAGIISQIRDYLYFLAYLYLP